MNEFYIKTAASPGIYNASAYLYIGGTNIYDIIESHYWRAIIVDVRPRGLGRLPSTSAAYVGVLNEKASVTQGKGRWRNISEDSEESGPGCKRNDAGDIDSHRTRLCIYVRIHRRNAWYFFLPLLLFRSFSTETFGFMTTTANAIGAEFLIYSVGQTNGKIEFE